MDGHQFRAGAFIIPNAERSAIEASLVDLGLSAWATRAAPEVPTHELDIPRIGYIHSWRRTQDEGWVRGTLDHYGVPYDYFDEKSVLDGDLRAKYDVIIYPHVGGSAQAHLRGVVVEGDLPLPYQRTDATPNLGGIDDSEDIRGGMGYEGLMALADFVKAGGTLIVEGSTASIFPEFEVTPDVIAETPEDLVAPGAVDRGVIVDPSSPLAYGYSGPQLPVFYRGDVVLRTGARRRGGGATAPWQNTTPMATLPTLSPYDLQAQGQPADSTREAGPLQAFREMAHRFQDRDRDDPRVVLAFPDDPDEILLSGTLGSAQTLAGTAQLVDAPLGEGHVVSFAIRPFWRWQTQGTFFLGFNAILNWNDLDAGQSDAAAADAAAAQSDR